MNYVQVEGLGKCEHCNRILNIIDYAGDERMSAVWICGGCSTAIERASFGYNKEDKKTRWVGPDGVWQDTKPAEDFTLGDLHIFVRSDPPEPYDVWRHGDQ